MTSEPDASPKPIDSRDHRKTLLAFAASPRKQGRFRRLIVWGLIASAGLAWYGNDRVPANPNQPLVINQAATSHTSQRETLRVGTFNIHGGKGTDDRRDLNRTAKSLHDLDIVGLNEVYGELTGFRQNQAEVLGESLEMNWLFAATTRRWWHDEFGNAVLTNQPLRNVVRIPLPVSGGKKFRNAILFNTDHQGATVQILVTHVDTRRDRERQLATVVPLFLSLAPPAILMGDLNTTASDPLMQELLNRPDVQDATGQLQNENGDDVANIDWIIARGLTCIATECRPSHASDHPAYVAEFTLSPAQAPPTPSEPTDVD